MNWGKMTPAYAYDDIVLEPQYSEIRSRFDPSTSCSICGLTRGVPIISANMDTVTGAEMCIAMWNVGAVGALHRFTSINIEVQEFQTVRAAGADALVTVGVSDWEQRTEALYAAGAKCFIVDIAHGHSVLMKEAVMGMRKKYKENIHIIAGNIATPQAVRDLKSWGADVVKLCVGGGSICKTRVVTGHGVPTFSCILECSDVAKQLKIETIADGGIRSSGDIMKALAAGANFVMVGSLLAGTNETPGNVIREFGKPERKVYRGMASFEAQSDRDPTEKVRVASEGVLSTIQCKGPVSPIMNELTMGIKSGMSYCNAMRLNEIPQKAKWRVQTHSGYIEGTPHIFSNK
jgi:IMP dehydrogenase